MGYALGVHHDADLAAAALCVAIAVRGGDVAGVVFHTDQGGEFTGGELTKVCARAGIVQSMGRTGSALDNAVAEAFHSTIEFELLSDGGSPPGPKPVGPWWPGWRSTTPSGCIPPTA